MTDDTGAERYWEGRWRDEAKENDRLRQTVNDQAAVIERLTREHEDPHHGLGRAGMKAAELLPELAVIRQVMKEAP